MHRGQTRKPLGAWREQYRSALLICRLGKDKNYEILRKAKVYRRTCSMTSLDEKQENPRDQGKERGKYYLPLFAHNHSLDAWMAFGDVVPPSFYAAEADQRQFLTDCKPAWEAYALS